MSEPTTAATMTVYSDYVCPFCYLGRASLEAYRDDTEDPPDVEWHQFDLRSYKRGPDGEIREGADDGKDEDYFEQVRENVARLRERYDVEMLDLADLPDDVDSWDAQAVALHVQREHDAETFEALNDALFEALWQDGRDIGDVEVVVDVATAVGIPEADVRAAVDDEGLQADLRERFERAREEGVTGVPTFAYGGHAARGAVPPEQLGRLVDGS
jgi:predicted DsbA family dithiol-disulfide isomerase